MSKYTEIYAPVGGKTKDVTKLSDPVFAQKMVGDGVAIYPNDSIIKAPCNGILNHVFGTNHAFTILTKENIEILVHIGIDTVELDGKGFIRIIEDISKPVTAGQDLIKIDLDYIRSQGKELDVIVIVSDSDSSFKFKKKLNKDLNANDLLFKFLVK
ncbi:MAG: PTS glucose transporter subunit IIA [Tenericutes bacterium]|nr:PTS glucose transporter subunit IIA [Mycoplasmatota bacterium]